MKKLADIVNLAFTNEDHALDLRDPWIAFCEDLNISESFHSLSLDKLSGLNDLIKQNLKDWFSGKHKNLIFFGGVGCGKTHTALTMLKFMQPKYRWIQYLPSTKILELGKELGDQYLRSVYGECDVLIIDDLGVERPAEWETKYLYAIVDERYSNKKRTIITTNMNEAALESIYTKRTMSRLNGQWTKFDDVDWRKVL
jgi:DNA replication protein DnaC